MNNDEKRLFFGFSIEAPWPTDYPEGRMIPEEGRHMTFSFLGNISYDKIKKQLSSFPRPNFSIGLLGKSRQLLFLPKQNSRVVAHDVKWLTNGDVLEKYHSDVLDWLKEHNFPADRRRPLLSHVSIARAPFDQKKWEETFQPLPIMISGIHLYESLGDLRYSSLWNIPLIPPFEEFEHTADIAFTIRANKENDLFLHAAFALSFRYPPFLQFLPSQFLAQSLEEIVRSLNHMIAKCDQEIGCPFKAVSYHGKTSKKENNLITWEMIVDV